MMLVALLALVGCESGRVEVGGPCANAFDCVDGAHCFSLPTSPEDQGRCMADCGAEERLCVGGEVCLSAASDPSTRVCYLGGRAILGAGCADTTDCETGAVCVDFGDGSPPICVQACDLRAAVCPMGQVCQELSEPSGFCGIPPEEEPVP